jgi:hypothetical protein
VRSIQNDLTKLEEQSFIEPRKEQEPSPPHHLEDTTEAVAVAEPSPQNQDLIAEYDLTEEAPAITQLSSEQLTLFKKKQQNTDYTTFSLGDLVAVIQSPKRNFIGKICGLPGEVEQYLISSKLDGNLYAVKKENLVFLCASTINS